MKLKSSIVAIIALSSMSFAGGDIGGVTTFENEDYVAAEVEAVEPKPEPKVEPKPMPKPEEPKPAVAGPLYISGAVSAMASRVSDRANPFAEESKQDRQIGLTGVIGYDFNEYLAAELRAAMGVANDNNDKMKQVGLYLKPQFPIAETGLNLYGLVGYGTSNMSDAGQLTGSNSGLTYGAGLDYGVTENISVFTDYVNYLKDDDTNSQWGANLGVKYNF